MDSKEVDALCILIEEAQMEAVSMLALSSCARNVQEAPAPTATPTATSIATPTIKGAWKQRLQDRMEQKQQQHAAKSSPAPRGEAAWANSASWGEPLPTGRSIWQPVPGDFNSSSSTTGRALFSSMPACQFGESSESNAVKARPLNVETFLKAM